MQPNSQPNEQPNNPNNLQDSFLEVKNFQPPQSLQEAQQAEQVQQLQQMPPQQAQAQLQAMQMAAAASAPAPKRSPLPLVLAIVFGLSTLGLGGFLIYDKFIANAGTTAEVAHTISSLTTPLSDALKTDATAEETLAGRVFVADNKLEEYIRFNNDNNFDINFYANPNEDIAKYSISTEHGKFSAKDKNLITIKDDSQFRINGNYLIKENDRLTNNKGEVYFDINQLPTITAGLTSAIKNHLNVWGGDASANANKANVNYFRCTTISNHLTNADNYMCATDFTIYFDDNTVNAAFAENGVKDFNQLCAKDSGYAFYKGDCNSQNNSIRLKRNIVIRINESDTNPQNYNIIGIYNNADEEE